MIRLYGSSDELLQDLYNLHNEMSSLLKQSDANLSLHEKFVWKTKIYTYSPPKIIPSSKEVVGKSCNALAVTDASIQNCKFLLLLKMLFLFVNKLSLFNARVTLLIPKEII